MADILRAALDKMNSGFFDPGPDGATPDLPAHTDHGPDTKSLEARITSIELHLGLRKPPSPPPLTHPTCSVSKLKLPLRFFPAIPQTANSPSNVSNLISGYKNALFEAQARMATPWTLTQADFDKHSPAFFPCDERVTVASIQGFLTAMAAKGVGRTAVQQFTNNSHRT